MATTLAEAIDIEVPPDCGVLCRLGKEGDTRITWNRGDAAGIAAAKAAFDQGRKDGMMAYKVSESGSKGEVIPAFDSTAEKIILAPPMRGGC